MSIDIWLFTYIRYFFKHVIIKERQVIQLILIFHAQHLSAWKIVHHVYISHQNL